MAKMNVYVPNSYEMKQFRDLAIPAARKFLEDTYKSDGKYWVDRFLKAIEDAERELGL